MIGIDLKENNIDRIKKYDFRSPNKFAKDNLNILKNIYNNYANLLKNHLAMYLSTTVDVNMSNIEVIAYKEFSNSIANPTILALIGSTTLNGHIIYQMDNSLGFALIERSLGGQGSLSEYNRRFSDIESTIIKNIISQFLRLMQNAWDNTSKLTFTLNRIETNIQFTQVINPNEAIALITLLVRIRNDNSMINICIPYSTIKPIISKLTTKTWYNVNNKEISEASKNSIKTRINETKIPVKAVLGSIDIPILELAKLQVGDCIPINRTTTQDIDILIGDMKKFKGKLGVKQNRVSFKITKIIDSELD